MVRSVLLASVALVAGCAGSPPQLPVATPDRPDVIARVAEIHGGAGPWAVAGYRMGEYARKKLDLKRYSFDLDVEHHTPHAVQYSCVADGVAAATGASAGKLNLRLVDADVAHFETRFRNTKTGAVVTLRPTASFVARFKDSPYERFAEDARAILALPDAAIFEEVTDAGGGAARP
jgi:formylmethanofuran dehydrogenase subunit E